MISTARAAAARASGNRCIRARIVARAYGIRGSPGVAVGAMVVTVAFMLSPMVFLRLLPAPFDFIQYPW